MGALPLRRVVSGFGIILAALIASSAGEPAHGQTINRDYAGDAQTRLSVALHWPPGIDFAGFYLAEDEGYYHAEGLEVRFTHYSPSGPSIRALGDGDADLAVAWQPTALLERDKGTPVVEIARLLTKSSLVLACRNARQIRETGPSGLSGKTIGRWAGAAGLPLDLWLSMMGLTPGGGPNAVSIREQPFPVEDALKMDTACLSARRHVEAPQLPEGFEPVFDIGNVGEPLQEDSVFAIARSASDPTQAARYARFLRASAAGWSLAYNNPEAAARAIATRTDRAVGTSLTAVLLANRRALSQSAFPVAPPSRKALHATAVYMLNAGDRPALNRYPEGIQNDTVFAAIGSLPKPRDRAAGNAVESE